MAATNPRNEKVRNLPLLCVETILKFTPTSKLIRLYSDAVLLPGAFWNLGLEVVLRKRLPLSLQDDLLRFPPRDVRNSKALFDITGAQIASVKKPGMFRFCPLREFIQSAALALVLPFEPRKLCLVHGDALISHTPNVVHLALIVYNVYWQCGDKDLFEPCVKHLLSQLQSFEVRICWVPWIVRVMAEAILSFIAEARIDEMNCLRHLVLPEAALDGLMRASVNQSNRMQAVLAGLSSLYIRHHDYDVLPFIGPSTLNFVVLSCGQLSHLEVVVRGEFRAYLAAFRAIPGLTSLGLCVRQADLRGLAFDGSNVISLVSDLRIIYPKHSDRTSILKIATFFPNVTTVGLEAEYDPDPLELVTSLFGKRQPFSAVTKLDFSCSGTLYFYAGERPLEFLANLHLPETVDLSQIIFDNMARYPDLLTETYCVMQANSIKSLLLRGPVHRASLSRLQDHIYFSKENAKISAWKDRDLVDPLAGILNHGAIAQQTDFKIIGLKTSGNLKGEQFTIRVLHQLAKRVDIFD